MKWLAEEKGLSENLFAIRKDLCRVIKPSSGLFYVASTARAMKSWGHKNRTVCGARSCPRLYGF